MESGSVANSVLKVGGLALLASAIATVSAATAFGHGRGFGGHGMWGHGAHHWIKRVDANADGVIELTEIEELRQKRFERFDADRNGVVSAEEIEQAVRQRVERMTKRLVRRFDVDRNGSITRQEFNRSARERFTWMDLNDDGRITREELPEFMRRRGPN